MKTIKMSVSQWIAVPPNPIQRNTERHAQKAKHLLTPLDVHAAVSAAQLPDGTYVKLDGHTRAYLWKHNQVRHPPEVLVNIFQVDDIEEAKRLYTTFDAKEAMETMTEKVSGAFYELSFTPTSGLLAAGNLSGALKHCWAQKHGFMSSSSIKQNSLNETGYSIYAAVREFSTELFALDSYGLRTSDAQGGIVAAFILTYRRHGKEILPFWRSVFANAGVRMDGKMDAVQALNELRLVRKGLSRGNSSMHDLCGRAVMAAERWRTDDLFTSIPRPYNMEGYIDNARPQEKLIKRTNG